jgi:type II secretory pathway predicted ATPase ExeA
MSDLRVEAGPTDSTRPVQPMSLARTGEVQQIVPATNLLKAGGEALYLSPAHLSALESLVASLLGCVPLVALTGPAGVGKTTLVEAAIPLLTERSLRVIRIENPGAAPLSLDGLLSGVLGMPAEAIMSEDDAARACEVLLFPPDGMRATVVMIDHAQTLQPDALRMLGMVSSQAGLSGHTVQILFIARCEFFDRLRDDAPGNLPGRITTRLALAPYSEQDARAFIDYRLGLPGDDLALSESALRAILERSGGLPGRINFNLDALLDAARRRGRRRVTARMVRRTLEARPAADGASRRPVAMARVAAMLALGLLLAGGTWIGVSRLMEQRPRPEITVAGNVAPANPPLSYIPSLGAQDQPGTAKRQASAADAAVAVPAAGGAAASIQPGAGGAEPDRPPASFGAAGDAGASSVIAAATPAATVPESVRIALKQRGDAMMAVGDVSTARLLYERAAEGGSGEAAAAAGKTYDPSVLALIGAVGIRPDPEAAARWYRRAIALGDQNAARWLKDLGAQTH